MVSGAGGLRRSDSPVRHHEQVGLESPTYVKNAYVINAYVKNAYVINAYVKNAYVKNAYVIKANL